LKERGREEARRSEVQNQIEWFGLEDTFKGHLAQPPCSENRLLRAPSGSTLNVPRDGASTTSLGNLC